MNWSAFLMVIGFGMLFTALAIEQRKVVATLWTLSILTLALAVGMATA